MVGIIDAPLKVELAVGDGKTPLAHHRRHRHVHQLPVVETGTIQVQLPKQKTFLASIHNHSPGIVQACHIVPQGSERMVAVDVERHIGEPVVKVSVELVPRSERLLDHNCPVGQPTCCVSYNLQDIVLTRSRFLLQSHLVTFWIEVVPDLLPDVLVDPPRLVEQSDPIDGLLLHQASLHPGDQEVGELVKDQKGSLYVVLLQPVHLQVSSPNSCTCLGFPTLPRLPELSKPFWLPGAPWRSTITCIFKTISYHARHF